MNEMKKILYIIASIILLASCEQEKTIAEKLIGDWHCTSTAIDAEIYVSFNAENTFVLYQQIGEGAFRVYNGTYELKAEGSQHTLVGAYNDGTPWGAEYVLNMSGADAMTLTAADITETYTRVPVGIPAEVTSSAVVVVKSENIEELPFL